MLSCEQVKPLLARLAEDDLDGHEGSVLARHLDACDACRAAATAQREVRAVLRARPAATPPPNLAARISAEIALESGWLGAVDWRGWSFRLAPLAAAVLVAALIWDGNGQSAESTPGLSPIIDTWVMGERTEGVPATALFWQTDVPSDTLLMTVLRSGPDDVLEQGAQDATR